MFLIGDLSILNLTILTSAVGCYESSSSEIEVRPCFNSASHRFFTVEKPLKIRLRSNVTGFSQQSNLYLFEY